MMAVMVHIRIELASLGFTVHGYRAISFELWRDFSKEERNCNKANILNLIENQFFPNPRLGLPPSPPHLGCGVSPLFATPQMGRASRPILPRGLKSQMRPRLILPWGQIRPCFQCKIRYALTLHFCLKGGGEKNLQKYQRVSL